MLAISGRDKSTNGAKSRRSISATIEDIPTFSSSIESFYVSNQTAMRYQSRRYEPLDFNDMILHARLKILAVTVLA